MPETIKLKSNKCNKGILSCDDPINNLNFS